MTADTSLPLETVCRDIGVSRFHFQRMFRAVLGITPGQYRRARRAERLRKNLADGHSVTEAIQSAGFASSSRAYEAEALGMTPSTFRAGARGEPIASSALGRVLVARTNRGVCAIHFGDDDTALITALRADFPRAVIVADEQALAANLRAVVALVEQGSAASGDALALDIRGTAFQRQVWNALNAIPVGE